MTQPAPGEGRRIGGVAPNVFFLGIVSFLTDISSEMTLTILPLFLKNVLGASTVTIGLIEGVAEGTASSMKVSSGWLSDRLRKRKLLTTLGYGLSTIAKPFLYLAASWGWVLGVRFADRLGKGIRTSPRDALLADSAAASERGKSFGLHRTLDSLGAVVGLGLAALIVFLTQRGALELSRYTYQKLVLVGIVPAVLAVLILIFFVREVKKQQPTPTATDPKSKATLPLKFKIYLAIMVLFTLGNSSDAFLILRAQNLGLSTLYILLLLVLFNLVYAVVATPAGTLSDRLGRRGVIAAGWLVYALVYLGFALAQAPLHVYILFAFYGIYYGITEGVGRALVADMVPAERRGTAYGLYHGAVGLSALPASLIAGWLWQAVNPAAPFYFGAALAGLAAILLLALVR